jgi:hypothetical protein
MAIGTFPGMLQEGDHASRPAATAVGSGALYACTTHSLIYQSDGSAWSTWWTGTGATDILDIPTAEMDDTLVLAPDGAGGVEFRAETGGGGGVDWNQVINESGASFANFTSLSGTWASDGTIIQQTQAPTGSNATEAYFTAAQAIGWGSILEFEARFPTTGQGAGANIQAKVIMGSTNTGGTTGAIAVVLETGTTDSVAIEKQGNANLKVWTTAIALDTWHKVRVVNNGVFLSAYLAGTLLGTTNLLGMPGLAGTVQATADYLKFSTYNAIVDWRNIKLWTLSTGAPA